MKNKKLILFKLKFFYERTFSSYLKKKIKKENNFQEFKNLIKYKDFSTYWFLNNFEIIGNYLPKDFSKSFSYLEIGSFEGLSSLFIVSNWRNANVTCVDTWQMSKDDSQFLDFNFNDVEKRFDLNLKDYSFKKIKNTSNEAFKN